MSTRGRLVGSLNRERMPSRLDPIRPVQVRDQDVGQACMWVAAASRILAAAGMGAEAEDLQRVLDRVAVLRSAPSVRADR